MTKYQSGQSAHDVHTALKCSLHTTEKAQQCAVLWFGEILERKLYRQLGYSSINRYAKLELGFSTSRTGDFLQLCNKLEKLPQVKAKVASGELGYTAARVLVTVSDESNQAGWLDFALNNSRRDLEREVKRAKQEAVAGKAGQPSLMPVVPQRPVAVVPVRVSLEMSPTQFARYEALWEQVRKRGDAAADKVEALLEIMAVYTTESSPRGDVSVVAKPPVQIHIHQCPDCAKATVPTSNGELEIGESDWTRAQCDCQVSRPGERNKASIPPAARRMVLAKHRHQCQRPGCGRTRFLEVHHIVPRSRGGSNDLENLTCLCSGCHRLVHEEKAGGWVKEVAGEYRWRCRSHPPLDATAIFI